MAPFDLTRYAPALGRAVAAKLDTGKSIDAIDELVISGAASLRGVRRLGGLETLVLDQVPSLAYLRGHPSLEQLCVRAHQRGRALDLEALATLPALTTLDLYSLRLGSLAVLASLRLRKLAARFCEAPAQRVELPPTLVELDLDATRGLRLRGVCPQLSLIDLWGTDTEPLGWVAQQPAVEELWLNGCRVPTLAPLMTMARPPRWIFMDGHDEDDLAPHREAIAALEAGGARFMLGWPHECGVWLPSSNQVSLHEREPLYLSPGWPREAPEG